MRRIIAMALIMVATGVAALATETPEIDPGSAASALALLAGAALMIRGRRRS
ncbi:MAG: hypothetical protein WBL65_03785 [Bryobacteraceae bacterium]